MIRTLREAKKHLQCPSMKLNVIRFPRRNRQFRWFHPQRCFPSSQWCHKTMMTLMNLKRHPFHNASQTLRSLEQVNLQWGRLLRSVRPGHRLQDQAQFPREGKQILPEVRQQVLQQWQSQLSLRGQGPPFPHRKCPPGTSPSPTFLVFPQSYHLRWAKDRRTSSPVSQVPMETHQLLPPRIHQAANARGQDSPALMLIPLRQIQHPSTYKVQRSQIRRDPERLPLGRSTQQRQRKMCAWKVETEKGWAVLLLWKRTATGSRPALCVRWSSRQCEYRLSFYYFRVYSHSVFLSQLLCVHLYVRKSVRIICACVRGGGDCCWWFLYSAILSSRVDSLRLHWHVTLHEWLAFYSVFLDIHWSGVLTALAWLVPPETAAVSSHSVYPIQPCTCKPPDNGWEWVIYRVGSLCPSFTPYDTEKTTKGMLRLFVV